MESDDYFPEQLLQIVHGGIVPECVVALCIGLTLLFFVTILSAAENTISSLSQEDLNEIENNPSKRDKIIGYLSDYLRLTRASCRIAHFFIIITVTALFIYSLSVLNLPIPLAVSYIIACLSTIILWFIAYGLLPKLFSGYKLQTARFMAPLLKVVLKIGTPFVHMTSMPVKYYENEQQKKSQTSSFVHEVPNDIYEEKEMLEEIIHFYNKKANEIMTPRTDIRAIELKSNIKNVINIIVESGYSRIPAYEDHEDNIKGILYAKDIIPALNQNNDFEWQALMRKPYFVPETKKIDGLLEELRSNKTHMAIVVDEFGCTSGLVTMEDIIEEIIGDITDEYDDEKDNFMSLPDGSYIFEGKIQLNDFFRETGIPPSDFSETTEEAETLTGLMLAIKGTLPHRSEIINYKNYQFRILEADDRRVLKVKFSINTPTQEDQ